MLGSLTGHTWPKGVSQSKQINPSQTLGNFSSGIDGQFQNYLFKKNGIDKFEFCYQTKYLLQAIQYSQVVWLSPTTPAEYMELLYLELINLMWNRQLMRCMHSPHLLWFVGQWSHVHSEEAWNKKCKCL